LLNIKKSSDILYEKDREAFKYAEEKQTRKIRDLEKHLKQVGDMIKHSSHYALSKFNWSILIAIFVTLFKKFQLHFRVRYLYFLLASNNFCLGGISNGQDAQLVNRRAWVQS
jgi:hypothetical protein